MQPIRKRLTVRRLMVLVALLGVAAALLRVHPSLSAFAAGVFSLAFLRTCEKTDRAIEAGRPPGTRKRVWTGLVSILVGMVLIVSPLLPILCLVPIFVPNRMHVGLVVERWRIIPGVIISAGVVVLILAPLKRAIW